jgi:hypothetical protein
MAQKSIFIPYFTLDFMIARIADYVTGWLFVPRCLPDMAGRG